MTRKGLSIGAAGFVVFAILAGCGKNEAATAKCKTSTTCAECCKENGATGNASGTVNGVYSCRCMGGH